jgi:hypothetical protein
MATAKKESKAAGPADKGLKVVSRPASFRRGGQTFTAEARIVPLSDLTEEQAAQIVEDPNLVVQLVDIPPPAETKKSEDKK